MLSSCKFVESSVLEPCNTHRVSTAQANTVSLMHGLPRAAKRSLSGAQLTQQSAPAPALPPLLLQLLLQLRLLLRGSAAVCHWSQRPDAHHILLLLLHLCYLPRWVSMVGRQVEAGYGTTGGQGCVESVSKLSWRAYQSSTVS